MQNSSDDGKNKKDTFAKQLRFINTLSISDPNKLTKLLAQVRAKPDPFAVTSRDIVDPNIELKISEFQKNSANNGIDAVSRRKAMISKNTRVDRFEVIAPDDSEGKKVIQFSFDSTGFKYGESKIPLEEATEGLKESQKDFILKAENTESKETLYCHTKKPTGL